VKDIDSLGYVMETLE